MGRSESICNVNFIYYKAWLIVVIIVVSRGAVDIVEWLAVEGDFGIVFDHDE